MKAIILRNPLLLIVFILLSFLSCSEAQEAEKLSSDEVSADEIKAGKNFITGLYKSLSTGSTYDFNKENSTEMMVNTFTPEMQRTTYEQIKAQLGEYENAEYEEAWAMSSNPDMKILRYKANFTGSNERVEIRVVFDKANKVAGFFVKPWLDMMM